MLFSLNNLERVLSLNTLPVADGKIKPFPSLNPHASFSTAMARSDMRYAMFPLLTSCAIDWNGPSPVTPINLAPVGKANLTGSRGSQD